MRRGFRGWRRRFREQGFRVTGPRLLVLDVLAAAKKHLTAKEIYTRVVERDPSVGAATIYRTLDVLVSLGLVTRNDFGEGFYRYELIRGGDDADHVHLICMNCGRTFNVEREGELADHISGLTGVLSDEHGFEVDGHRLNFFGTCSICREERD
jgi:Fur family ferric uptake transcriptional regulator